MFSLPDCFWQQEFRMKKLQFPNAVGSVAWPSWRRATEQNLFITSSTLAAPVILQRLASPCRWPYISLLFGRHLSHLSKIFWEDLQSFLKKRPSPRTRYIPIFCGRKGNEL